MTASSRRQIRRTNIPSLYKVDPSRIFPEGSWEIRYRDDLNHTRRKRFRTKQEALDFQASVRTDKRRGDFIDPRLARTPLALIAERWYEMTTGLTPATRAGYQSVLHTHLLPKLGDLPVNKISPSEIKSMLTGSGLTVGTQRNILGVLNLVLNVAIDDGMIRRNPCGRVKLAQKPSTKRTFLTAEQVTSLAHEIDSRFSTLVYFAAYTGMRAGEIVALRLRCVDLLRARVKVEESATDVRGRLHFGPPKNGKPRNIALPRFLVERLGAAVNGKASADFLFEAPSGGMLRHANFYARFFKPAVARLGLPHLPVPITDVVCRLCPDEAAAEIHTRPPFRFHDLRHTAASLLIARGVHPKAVSEHLGHSSIAITMDLYGHLYPDYEEAIVTALEDTYQRGASSPVGAESSAPVVPIR